MMKPKITRDGPKNVVVMINGTSEETGGEKVTVVTPKEVKVRKLKLDQIHYAIEKDLRVYIGWSEDGPLLPLDGRGVLNYDAFDSLQPSSNDQGLWIMTKGEGLFHLVFDMTKQ